MLWSPARILILAFILGLLLALNVLAVAWTTSLALTNCHRVNTIDVRIQNIERRQLATLGAKGSPGYAYYLTHPDELKAAQAETRNLILQFTPTQCSLKL